MVRFLTARQGVNINATTASGYTPLHQASQQGHSTIVSHLLDKGADPNLLTSVSKNIILYYFTKPILVNQWKYISMKITI